MKRILAVTLTLVMLAYLTGCMASQLDNNYQNPEISQTNNSLGTEESVYNSQDDDNSQEVDVSQDNDISQEVDVSQDSDISQEVDVSQDNDASQNDDAVFKYNKYMIREDAWDHISEREYMLYCQMIDSILAYDGVISGFESYEEFEKMWEFLVSEFTPVRGFIQTYLVSDEPFIYKDGIATLKFVADKETCLQQYAEFESIINEALSLIKEDDSDWQRIAKLYLYVSEHMTYGNVYELYGIKADDYNAIRYGIGWCGSYAYFLNMLAQQIGFETIDSSSIGKDGFFYADHAWSMIRVEGQWYHFDACWQAPRETHEYMDYFAFNTKDRYNTLANNSPWGEPGEVEMFKMHYYTNERSELPYCDKGMSENDRVQLYYSVIEEYLNDLSKDIPKDMLDNYIDAAILKVMESIAAGGEVGIEFRIKNKTMNSAVHDLILTYSPQDLQYYPELEDSAEFCKTTTIILRNIDQTDLKSLLWFIIMEDIVIDTSVRLVVL